MKMCVKTDDVEEENEKVKKKIAIIINIREKRRRKGARKMTKDAGRKLCLELFLVVYTRRVVKREA